MSRQRWVSNGPGSSKNEQALLGEVVVFRTRGRIRAIGRLKLVRAQTRGNKTLAVVWKRRRPWDGKRVRVETTLWSHRESVDFTIERPNPDSISEREFLERNQ